MLKELRHYNNLGTPSYFFQLFTALNNSNQTNWKFNDLNQLFFNKIVEGRDIHDGCIALAVKIEILFVEGDFYSLNKSFAGFLNTERQMADKFNEYLFRALKEDTTFHGVFCSKYLSYDIIYKSIQISNAAFGFKFSNFKQLLIDFNVIESHPAPGIRKFIINSRYKKLFDKTVLPEIKKRKIGIDELRSSLEQQQIYGEEAEKYVLTFESTRLNDKKEVEWVAAYVVNEGYDIASYNSDYDSEYNRFIEVKSYEGNRPYFFWSRNECLVAQRKRDQYWLYLVNRSEMEKGEYAPMMIQDPCRNILESEEWSKQIDKYKIEFNIPGTPLCVAGGGCL